MLTGIPFIDMHGALRAGQMVEVCGVGGSGKTEILMQAAVNCIMPRSRGQGTVSSSCLPISVPACSPPQHLSPTSAGRTRGPVEIMPDVL